MIKHSQSDVVLNHGDGGILVVGIHVPRDALRESRHRIGAPRGVLRVVDVARTRETAHQARATDAVHPVPLEIAKVDPECVGLLFAILLPRGGNLGLVPEGLSRTGNGHARVRGTGEPRGGDGERALTVLREVSSVPRHGAEREDGAPAIVRGEAHNGAGGVLAAVLAAKGGEDTESTEVDQGAGLICEGELRGGRLVLPKAFDFRIDVHLAVVLVSGLVVLVSVLMSVLGSIHHRRPRSLRLRDPCRPGNGRRTGLAPWVEAHWDQLRLSGRGKLSQSS